MNTDTAPKGDTGLQDQMNGLHQSNTHINELAQTASGISTEASNHTQETVATIEDASRNIHDLITSVSDIEGRLEDLTKALERVSKVASNIDAIAKQTNLLALNATIEAARAGNAGKGFAVVAGEVKNLSKQTSEATTEISDTVGELETQIQRLSEASTISRSKADTVSTDTENVAEAVDDLETIFGLLQTHVSEISEVSGNNLGICAEVSASLEVTDEANLQAAQ